MLGNKAGAPAPIPPAEPLVYTKEPFREVAAPRKIKSIRFGLQSSQEVVKSSEFHVYERNLYEMPQRVPLSNGVLDRRLGTSDKKGECTTCRGKLQDCAGHFGHIKLELPVFHIGYFKHTIAILQCICKKCARVMVTGDERAGFLKKFRSPRTEVLQRAATFKKLNERCKRTKICPHCGEVNGVVKKATQALKIIHDKYAKNQHEMRAMIADFEEAMKYNDQIKSNLSKVQDDMNPIRVLELFEQITREDAELLDCYYRPEHLIMQNLPVPPVCIRPSVEMETAAGSNEDDITMKLMQIIEVNNVLRQGLDKGLAIMNFMEQWDFLQCQCAMYINSELPGLPLNFQTPGKPLRGFVQRLKGKQGRFRGNLSGKRVDFSGRTVISPDPNLKVTEVGVPIHVAMHMTYPERVSRYNIEKLRNCIINGMTRHPGANFVIFPDGNKWFLKYGDRRKVAAELKIGDIVERHMEDGDVVLFNRQPSLHKMSLMAHRARVLQWRTLRFNESVCNPYNADFDGDEMNLHLPQTEEARTEAINLMGVQSNLCTPKNGEILVSATQDFLTSSYLLSRKDCFLDRATFTLLCTYMGDGLDHIDLPTPTILKPVELWTGKQLFGVLVRPNASVRVFVNLELTEKNYTKKNQHMCLSDGYVCFRNSELISGQIGKGTLGNGTKQGLFSVLLAEYNAEASCRVMNRLAKLSARFIGNRGFSIGIEDVTPSPHLVVEKTKTVNAGYAKCDDAMTQFKLGTLACSPGCNAEQTIEATMTGELNKIREAAGNVCIRELPWLYNSPLIMASCGSKGSTINISQMIACVGQQAVGGERIQNGFVDRTLPHFPRGARLPASKGFVASSFYSGLAATEFFFHTMAGREGLVDTAVKTAETGYMSRRLMKALEDLYSHYDGSVRNSTGGIVQLVYGDDGLDPVSMEGKDGKPCEFARVLNNVCVMNTRAADQEVLLPKELTDFADDRVANDSALSEEAGCSQQFRDDLQQFLHSKAKDLEAAPLEEGEPPRRLLEGLCQRQVDLFLENCKLKYFSKRIEPASAVGAVGAQSIGEPGTQMTLKTFHFAGVASMNVTLGVPRIKEIINAAKNISTPIITAALDNDSDVRAARVVKGRLEKTTLGQIAKHIKTVLRSTSCYLSVKLDLEAIEALQLEIDVRTVYQSILETTKLRLKDKHVTARYPDKIIVSPQHDQRGQMYFSLQTLRKALPNVIVKGIPAVARAVINNLPGGKFNLLVEGTNLQAVMGTPGIKGAQTTSNHIFEAEKFLGIEAARRCIIHEIQYTMGSHGMSIDSRHCMLLADVMTYKGEVLGITRFGIAKMKDSVLMLASFEKTTDHLFEAAVRGRTDEIVGVSECIIMGVPMPIGTGLFKIHQSKDKELDHLPRRPPLILDD